MNKSRSGASKLLNTLIGEIVVTCSLQDMPNLIMHTKNYSETGIFVNFDHRFHDVKIGEQIKVQMFLPNEIARKQNCQIVRVEESGIALTFI